jgi:hypothetical protein
MEADDLCQGRSERTIDALATKSAEVQSGIGYLSPHPIQRLLRFICRSTRREFAEICFLDRADYNLLLTSSVDHQIVGI